ncbi:CST complex subunit CTC1 isoform X2 [Stegostoma tigrinum]|uniref:CST complex subunit CTC1 isoform X2 n=1 Tax=Stegostoma tigrinum TaxID=3053191 RepID=UPI0028708F1F|nr:CST complex subunit CTC1 isoform X2 [Stegostoma tigrinum]
MEEFVSEFGKLSSAYVQWLQNLYRFTEENIVPVAVDCEISCKELSSCLFRCLCRICHNHSNTCGYQGKDGLILPLSYRFISIEELHSQQKNPCCSQLTWSTSQFKQWTAHKGNLLISQKALSRTNLLLCGLLTDKTSIVLSSSKSQEQQSGGILYLQDKSGIIPCEIIKLDARRLGHIVMLPSWSYIPLTNAVWTLSGTEAGYIEIIEAPFLVFPKLLVGSLLVPNTLNVLLPDSAIHLLDKGFCCHKVKMNIAGELVRLSSLISIREKTFFFFFLNSFESDVSLPVLVQGTSYKVFVVSSSSDFYLYVEGSVKKQTLAEFMSVSHMKQTFKSELTSLVCKEETLQNRSSIDWSTQNTMEKMFESRQSRICSYRGMISKVLNIAAGLYELDGKFGLCVAYQQVVNYGRGLRPGAQVEIHDAHVHQNASDHFPHIILCCCLRSTLVIIEFSGLSTEFQPFCSSGNVHISLLFKYNLDLPNYLWVVHIIETFTQRFCPQFLTKQHILMCDIDSGIIGMFFNSVLKYTRWNLVAKSVRNIHQEILAKSHHCPLKEIAQPSYPCQNLSLSELLSLAEERAWQSLHLPSLLPHAEIKYLIAHQLNSKLAWSFEVLKPGDFQPQMILHGIFQANSRTGHLQLLDASGTLDCVVQNPNEVNQIAFSDTSYLDCLVQLQKYQLVIERFVHSEFPSSKQLDDLTFIKEKHTRIYVQFCAADLQVLKRRAASTRPKLHNPALSSTLSTRARIAAHSSCNEACRNDELNSITSNQHQDSPSLPKMPRLEEVVLQEGHVGESRTVCSHPLWTGDEAVGIPGGRSQLSGTGTPPGHSTSCTRQRKEETCSVGCVTQLILVTHKDALMLRNCQYGRNEGCEHTNGSEEAFIKRTKPRLRLAFQASAVNIGSPREWKDKSKIEGLPELETDPSLCSEHNNRTEVLLDFMGKSVKWYHLINPGAVYRVIASKQLGASVFEQFGSSTIPRKTLQSLNCPLFITFQSGWNLQYISTLSCLHQSQLSKNRINLSAYFENLASKITHLCTIQEVLSLSFSAPLVSFTGIILERICINPNRRTNFAAVITDKSAQGVLVPSDWGLKLTVGDVQNTAIALHIYVNFTMLSYILGILPGTVVLFCSLERTISRHSNVYCRYLSSSSVSILDHPSPEDVRSTSADLPLMYLGNLISSRGSHLQGIACCHVVNVCWLKLQWVCSLCCSIIKQGKCTRSSGPCVSTVGIFRANASAIVDDGTAEARVYCKDKQVAHLLALDSMKWERLQQHIEPQGEVYFQYQGRTGRELYEENTGDVLMQYLGVLCTSPVVCRPIQLAFRIDSRSKPKLGQNEIFQLRTFSCGDHQYMTKMTPALSLTCLDIKEVDYRKLCHLANDKLTQ